ncbi:hypothetical protein FCM35_KLT06473 [Carex littledalei]|uniref:Uncharacterized protein n=1 Tax=Carex littledalei TaxID=544730 RepID=A0A833V7R4_9POAL|nr:hypothetical protein FCM35_KLT06473 [Carex littledalei]
METSTLHFSLVCNLDFLSRFNTTALRGTMMSYKTRPPQSDGEEGNQYYSITSNCVFNHQNMKGMMKPMTILDQSSRKQNLTREPFTRLECQVCKHFLDAVEKKHYLLLFPDWDQDQLSKVAFLNSRKGFIKLAIEMGSPLLPVSVLASWTLGENIGLLWVDSMWYQFLNSGKTPVELLAKALAKAARAAKQAIRSRIKAAKQRAQAIAAKLFSNAEAKRPKTNNGSDLGNGTGVSPAFFLTCCY